MVFKPHFPQHTDESRLVANRVQKRDDLDSDERIVRILTGPFETRQRFWIVAEANMNHREPEVRNVARVR